MRIIDADGERNATQDNAIFGIDSIQVVRAAPTPARDAFDRARDRELRGLERKAWAARNVDAIAFAVCFAALALPFVVAVLIWLVFA